MLLCPECGERTWTYDRAKGVRICKNGHRCRSIGVGAVPGVPTGPPPARHRVLALAAVGGALGAVAFKLVEGLL